MAKKVSAAAEALEIARNAASGGEWIAVYNAVFGIGGASTALFPDQSSRTAFSKTPEFADISALIESLQEKSESASASGKLLVRIPRSLHVALQKESESEGVSINQLVVAKLSTQLRAVV